MRKKYIHLSTAALALSASISCNNVPKVTYIKNIERNAHRERIVEKNYKIGAVASTTVGNPIIRVKDYFVTIKPQNQVEIKDKFEIIGDGVHVVGNPGDTFRVLGIVEKDGKQFIQLHNGGGPNEFRSGIYFYVNQDGEFYTKVDRENVWYIMSEPTVSIVPSNYKLSLAWLKDVVVDQGYQNFEIIYSGKDNQGIHATYREFTPDNYARQAFYQNLTFPSDSKTIRFRNFVITVIDSSGENLTHTVTSD